VGYALTLEQVAFILDLFYAGLSLRRISRLFRTRYKFPISPATILRRILCWVKNVDEALTYFMERGEQGFEPHLGDIWEIDELHVDLGKANLPLIVVRDLKTGFDVGVHLADTVTSEAVEIALTNAKAVAHKCPLELRCDGLLVYAIAVKHVFGDRTKLSVHRRIRKEGQNQSIEGHNGVIRNRLNAMRSLHSKEKSWIIVKGIIIDYNFVRPSSSLFDKTPAELTYNRSADGMYSWYTLLELAEDYSKKVANTRVNEGCFKNQEEPVQDQHPSIKKSSISANITLDSYLGVHEVPGDMKPAELGGMPNAEDCPSQCPATSRPDGHHEEVSPLDKKRKWIFNRTEKQMTFDNSAQLMIRNDKQATLDNFFSLGSKSG